MSNVAKNFTITLDEVYIKTGMKKTKCSNLDIKWERSGGNNIVCIEKDGRVLDVQVPPNSSEKCFYAVVTCLDNGVKCTDCESKRIKICPCKDNSDCSGCEVCGDNGICISICDPEQVCDKNNNCVDCDETKPCKDGKVCQNGKCVCPPNKPYTDQYGNCSSCKEDTCDTGFVCTPEGCVPIDCEVGVFNVDLKTCVECNKTGDCKGEFEECVDNKCNCIKGYVRDIETGKCVKGPVCDKDSDCIGDCLTCDQNGACVPRKCPPNQICVPGLGCVDECDCVDRKCSNGGSGCANHPTIPNKCYCVNCGDSSCNQEGGSECGPASDRDACICDESNNCVPNPCNGITCPTGFTCVNGECVLNGTGGNGSGCKNQLSLTKNDSDCSVTANLVKDCCPCPKVGAVLKYLYNNSVITGATVEYRKGGTSGPLFTTISNNNVAHNELLNGGAIIFEFIPYETLNGVEVPVSSFQLVGDKAQTFVKGSGSSIASGSIDYSKLVGYSRVEVKVYREQLELGGANCRFLKELIDEFTLLEGASSLVISDQTPVEDLIFNVGNSDPNVCAKALYTWVQGGRVIRQQYNGSSDTISYDHSGLDFGSEIDLRLKPCEDVTVDSSCACGPKTIDTDFCNPEESIFNFTDTCRKDLEITIPSTCKLHADNLTIYRITLDDFTEDVPSSTSETVLTYLRPNSIKSAKVELVCANGTVVCESVDEIEDLKAEVPKEGICNPTTVNSGKDFCGTLVFPPSLESVILKSPSSVELIGGGILSAGTILNDPSSSVGNTFTICGDLERIVVEYGGCSDRTGQTEVVEIPETSSKKCQLQARVTDPCDCSTRNTVGGYTGGSSNEECFGELITWDITGYDRIVVDDFIIVGVAYLKSGELANKDSIQRLLDSQTGSDRTLEMCVRGEYEVRARAVSNISTVDDIAVNNRNTCLYNCCCSVSFYKFVDNSYCEGEMPKLQINGSQGCVLVFDVDQIGGSTTQRSITFSEENNIVDFPLPTGSYKVRLVDIQGLCSDIEVPDIETSVTIEPSVSYVTTFGYNKISTGCQLSLKVVEANGQNVSGANVVSENPSIFLGLTNSQGELTAPVTEGATIRVTISGSGECGDREYTDVVQCDCPQGIVPSITGSPFCDGTTSVTLQSSSIPNGVTAQWGINGTAQIGQNGNTFTINNPIPGTVVNLTFTDSNGCKEETAYVLESGGNISAIINQGSSATLCPGKDIVLSITATNALSYEWSIPNGSNITLTQNGIQDPTAKFTMPEPMNGFPFTVTATVTNSAGCTDTVDFTFNEDTNCPDCSGVFDVNSVSETCNANDTSDGSVTISTQSNIGVVTYSLGGFGSNTTGQFDNLSQGTYSWTVQYGVNCSDTGIVVVGDSNNCNVNCPQAVIVDSVNCNNDGTGSVQISGVSNHSLYFNTTNSTFDPSDPLDNSNGWSTFSNNSNLASGTYFFVGLNNDGSECTTNVLEVTVNCGSGNCTDSVDFVNSNPNNGITVSCQSNSTIDVTSIGNLQAICTGCCSGQIGSYNVTKTITSSNSSFSEINRTFNNATINCSSQLGVSGGATRDCSQFNVGDVITSTTTFTFNLSDCQNAGSNTATIVDTYTIQASDLSCCTTTCTNPPTISVETPTGSCGDVVVNIGGNAGLVTYSGPQTGTLGNGTGQYTITGPLTANNGLQGQYTITVVGINGCPDEVLSINLGCSQLESITGQINDPQCLQNGRVSLSYSAQFFGCIGGSISTSNLLINGTTPSNITYSSGNSPISCSGNGSNNIIRFDNDPTLSGQVVTASMDITVGGVTQNLNGTFTYPTC